jgi:hypothetical protein
MSALPSSMVTKLMIAVEVARRAAVRRNGGRWVNLYARVVPSILRDPDVLRTMEWIIGERARDLSSLSEARQEAGDALSLAIETTCQGAGRNRKHGCEDCGYPFAGPMLHDPVWDAIAARIEVLCFNCIEQRLGRELTRADLLDCPFKAGWIEFDPADAAARQFALGRHLIGTAPDPPPPHEAAPEADPSAPADPPLLRRGRTAGAAS